MTLQYLISFDRLPPRSSPKRPERTSGVVHSLHPEQINGNTGRRTAEYHTKEGTPNGSSLLLRRQGGRAIQKTLERFCRGTINRL